VAIKIKIPGKSGARSRLRLGRRSWFADPVVKAGIASFIIVSTALLGIFAFYYIRYQKIVDRRMRGQIFANASKIYAAPRLVRLGHKIDARQIAADLRRAGYSEDGDNNQSRMGSFHLTASGIDVMPGTESYHSPEGAAITVGSDDKVKNIRSLGSRTGEKLAAYELEPQLVTALFDVQQRAKRRLITYDEIPKVLIDAVLAIEDRRFFQHSGVNYFRLAEAAWVDLRQGKHQQGGSTLTMQIARGFFLTPEKTVQRKLAEMLISMELEQRFTKKQIFELYANQTYMGQRGSFTITGFGEAAQAYFGKDIKNLTLPEAALLAGIIQRPNYLSPYKNPERALERRNLVLAAMVETGAISQEEADRAKAALLKLAPPNVEASDAPYFVDLVKDTLLERYSEQELNENGYRIYTTLDPDLQRAAAEAIETGMKVVDAQVQKLRTRKVKVGKGNKAKIETRILPGPQAQVALIAMDPHTGEVRALVGGRNYGISQLNHAVARRPTGSVFKPFVYAAAMNTAVSGQQPVFTPASMVEDSPTTFTYGDQIYEPRNYKEEYHGQVTARYALALSLNNATVKLAEEVGYDKVAQLAQAAGITSVKPTPAMALGAYEATPLDVASAYTIFANAGTRLSSVLVSSLRNARGDPIEDFQPESKLVLDPRVSYVMTNMMEGVLNFGTAAGVRAKFTAPAAGKTGSSHDGWFAGYTTNLLCIIWVGYDDYSDLRLSGANTAAPIWAEFMKHAAALPQYEDTTAFTPPSGIIGVKLDKVTNRLATATCPEFYSAAFIAGTEPKETCDQATAQQRGFFSRLFGLGPKPQPPLTPPASASAPTSGSAQASGEDLTKKKKGFFGKILGVFKGGDDQKKGPGPQPRADGRPR